jgi:hypothetical protein
MQTDRIVSAVVEYFYYFWVYHDVPQYFTGKPEGLEVASLIHMPDVYKESVSAVIELDHLHEASFS